MEPTNNEMGGATRMADEADEEYAKGEWLNTTAEITITIHNNTLERRFMLVDGKLPENINEKLQEVVDTLLDTSEL
jgi:hypothetical protein